MRLGNGSTEPDLICTTVSGLDQDLLLDSAMPLHGSARRGTLRLTAGSALDSRSEILACPWGREAAKRRLPLDRVEGVSKPLASRTPRNRSSRPKEAGRGQLLEALAYDDGTTLSPP